MAGGTETVDSKNFYIVASAPNEPSLQVKISGPYLTKQAAQADLSAAIVEAKGYRPQRRELRLQHRQSRESQARRDPAYGLSRLTIRLYPLLSQLDFSSSLKLAPP